MKKLSMLGGTVLMVSLLSGCYTTGLSTRETQGFNYSNFVYGLYNDPTAKAVSASEIHLPLRVAIAQVGETTPPKIVKDKLLVERDLVAAVMEIPAGGPGINYGYNHYNDNTQKTENTVEAANQLRKMLALSKDLNAEYLFVFGGTADISQSQGWMGVLDFSIIGCFIFPSHDIVVDGKASGALIEVNTGKVLYIVSSQNETEGKAATIAVEGKRDRIMVEMRNKLLDSLTDELILKLRALDDGVRVNKNT